jgi:hypothetical protein
MVAGDASSTTYDENDNAQKAIGYICWRSGGQAGPRLPSERIAQCEALPSLLTHSVSR